MIVREGLPLTSVYFINRGICHVLSGDEGHVGTLSNTDNFGLDDFSSAALNVSEPTVSKSVQAVTYCDVMSLSVDHLQELIVCDTTFQASLASRRQGGGQAGGKQRERAKSGMRFLRSGTVNLSREKSRKPSKDGKSGAPAAESFRQSFKDKDRDKEGRGANGANGKAILENGVLGSNEATTGQSQASSTTFRKAMAAKSRQTSQLSA